MKIDVQDFARSATLIRGRHTEAAVVQRMTGCTGEAVQFTAAGVRRVALSALCRDLR
jgi:hypothetical protein